MTCANAGRSAGAACYRLARLALFWPTTTGPVRPRHDPAGGCPLVVVRGPEGSRGSDGSCRWRPVMAADLTAGIARGLRGGIGAPAFVRLHVTPQGVAPLRCAPQPRA